MADRQYDGILQMIEMIVDSCKDLEEAKRKIAELRRDKTENSTSESKHYPDTCKAERYFVRSAWIRIS